MSINYQHRFDDMKVVVRNIHDFEHNSKPLMTVLTPEELSDPEALLSTPGNIERPLFKCGFCLDAYISHDPKSETQMLNHLADL